MKIVAITAGAVILVGGLLLAGMVIMSGDVGFMFNWKIK